MKRLIGQRRVETLLARAVATGRVGHAYLFLGPPGSGKSTAARLFAMAMNCVQGDGGRGTGDGPEVRASLHPSSFIPSLRSGQALHPFARLAPCGSCESCRRILAGTHPEVMEVRPESKTGQNISVDQAREIRRNAALRPKLGLRRVYLIPNAEAFNEESANALLKTLEEPSDFVTLLLCAPGPSQVLPTIRSRCQIVRFGLAAPEELAEALQAAGTEPEAARALARASGGRPGLALTWAQEPSALRQRARVLELFAGALSAQRRARDEPQVGILSLRLAEQLRGLAGPEKGEEDGPARPAKALHSENLETGLSYLRDLLLLAGGASAELAQNQDRLSELIDLAGHTDPGRVLDDVRAVREAQQFLERNVAPQLVLERMFWGLISGAVSSQPGLFRDAL